MIFKVSVASLSGGRNKTKSHKNTDRKLGMYLNKLCKKNQLVHLDEPIDVYVCAYYTVRQNFPNRSVVCRDLLIISGKPALHMVVLFLPHFQLLSCTKGN